MTGILKKYNTRLILLVSIIVMPAWAAAGHAAGFFKFGDMEKPQPEFTRSGGRISARLIPRAKSSRVEIVFNVTAGGELDNVEGVDFFAVEKPEVDIKNFKSAVFEINITPAAPGGAVTVAVQSDFFSQSTAFYIYNPTRNPPWIKNAQSENNALSGRVRQLVISARDGGDFDADGSADGHIKIIGGPRDSFWGYALGTLFIRFFGIFIVLTVLMAGMILSGMIFKKLLNAKAANSLPTGAAQPAQSNQPTPDSENVSETLAAAVGLALHLHFKASAGGSATAADTDFDNIWGRSGRLRIMNERLQAFHRSK